MKQDYNITIDTMGKEKGEQLIQKLKKLKPKFDKLNYYEKLKFWEDNDLALTISTYFFTEGENRNEPKNHITIFPEKENYDLYFNWYFEHIKTFKPLQFDLEKKKEHYFLIINENLLALEYTVGELLTYQKRFNKYYERDERLLSPPYKKGYNSYLKKENITFDYHDFIYNCLDYLLFGKIDAEFIPFLDEQRLRLIEEKNNPKKENSEIDNDILEVRTKLILLNRLGIIKLLQGFEPFENSTELCKFLTELIETKEENKKKTFETIRTDIRYIDLPQKKTKKSPNTPTALRKVNSILTKYGLPPIN